MNGVIGYFGPVQMDNPLLSPGDWDMSQNPLLSTPPAKVKLSLAEVKNALRIFRLPSWNSLNPSQQKMVAVYILNQRQDPASSAQASAVLQSNPAFQAFEIIYGAAML